MRSRGLVMRCRGLEIPRRAHISKCGHIAGLVICIYIKMRIYICICICICICIYMYMYMYIYVYSNAVI